MSLFCSSVLAAPGGLPASAVGSEFEAVPAEQSTPAYFETGGWLVFSVPVAGDLLFACPPLAGPDPDCASVVLPIRTIGSEIQPWFIDEDSGAAWFKISVPPMGDFLLACFDPKGAPYCQLPEIEDRPPTATLQRLGTVGDAEAGGAGLLPLPMPTAGSVPLPASSAGDGCGASPSGCNSPLFWMTASLPTPGPVTLYACGGLDKEPACRVAVSGLDYIDAEDFGLQKLSQVETGSGGVGVAIGGVVADSVAAEAGLREGDVVTAAAGFELLFVAHLKGLLSQVAVGDSIRLEIEGRGLIKLTRRSRR